MAIVRCLIYLQHELLKKREKKNASFFVGLCLVLTGFISREEHLAAEAVKSAEMKDNLVFINFSMTKALVMKIQNYPQSFVIIHHACWAVRCLSASGSVYLL